MHPSLRQAMGGHPFPPHSRPVTCATPLPALPNLTGVAQVTQVSVTVSRLCIQDEHFPGFPVSLDSSLRCLPACECCPFSSRAATIFL